MSKKNTNKKSSTKPKVRKFTEKEIFTMISAAVLEKMRDKKRFAITYEYTELGMRDVGYVPLTDDEISVMESAKYDYYDEEDFNLEDRLVMMGGQEKFIERLKKEVAVSDPDYYVLVDFDLNDYLYEIVMEVSLVKEKICGKQGYLFDEKDFCDLLKMHIKCHNKVSVNNMVYEKPNIATRIIKMVAQSLHTWSDDDDSFRNWNYVKPFTVELTDFQEITDGIMNPRRDEIGLFRENYNEMEKFLEKYAIIPDIMPLDKEEGGYESDVFIDFTCFYMVMGLFEMYGEGKKYTRTHLMIKVKAGEVCDALNLKDYKDLANYCNEHYNTIDAVRNFRNDLLKICPEAIVE